MKDRSGGFDPQIVVPGTPSPNGGRVITPGHNPPNPLSIAIEANRATIEMMGKDFARFNRGIGSLSIGIAAMHSALADILDEETAKRFKQRVREYEQKHAEVHQLFSRMSQEKLPMAKRIEEIRDFNISHDLQIAGEQFGLADYLNDNPDNLTDPERDALAMEFGLVVNRPEVSEEVTDAG